MILTDQKLLVEKRKEIFEKELQQKKFKYSFVNERRLIPYITVLIQLIL